MKAARRMLPLLLWLALAAAPAAPATPSGAQPAAAHELSMDQAVQKVERQFHARVVKAESLRENGRTVYALKLLNDSGKVWTVHVDAATGALQ